MASQEDHGIVNFDAVIDGRIWRGGQPVVPGSWSFLKSIGIKTVVKLNFPEEGVDDGAVSAGLTVLSFSVQPRDFWGSIGGPQLEDVRAAATALADPAKQPVYVHCLHGQDRTGIVVGVYRVLHDGWTTDEAYREMRAYGFHPELIDLLATWREFSLSLPKS
jgi:protein tyrosine/serine phosphatase